MPYDWLIFRFLRHYVVKKMTCDILKIMQLLRHQFSRLLNSEKTGLYTKKVRFTMNLKKNERSIQRISSAKIEDLEFQKHFSWLLSPSLLMWNNFHGSFDSYVKPGICVWKNNHNISRILIISKIFQHRISLDQDLVSLNIKVLIVKRVLCFSTFCHICIFLTNFISN